MPIELRSKEGIVMSLSVANRYYSEQVSVAIQGNVKARHLVKTDVLDVYLNEVLLTRGMARCSRYFEVRGTAGEPRLFFRYSTKKQQWVMAEQPVLL